MPYNNMLNNSAIIIFKCFNTWTHGMDGILAILPLSKPRSLPHKPPSPGSLPVWSWRRGVTKIKLRHWAHILLHSSFFFFFAWGRVLLSSVASSTTRIKTKVNLLSLLNSTWELNLCNQLYDLSIINDNVERYPEAGFIYRAVCSEQSFAVIQSAAPSMFSLFPTLTYINTICLNERTDDKITTDPPVSLDESDDLSSSAILYRWRDYVMHWSILHYT